MGSRVCTDCVTAPEMKCGRCTATQCKRHALAHNRRCDRCEGDWKEEAPTRRAAKMIFAPPIAILAGGLLFGLLLPVSFSAIGAAIMCALVCGIAVGAGAGTCRLVDHSSRVMFLRERAGGLPPARLLSAPKR
ncbi:MAG TPA: hypothetical protein VIV11_09690 [Kofleriaceae bacterium]